MPTNEVYRQIVEKNTPELFQWIRETKALLGITNKDIADATGVPLGTVDPIIAGKRSEVRRSTLQPIVAYLANLYEKTLPPDTHEQAEINTNSLEGLKMVVQIRDAELKALNEAYDHIKKGYNNLREDYDKAAADNKAKVDYLKERVEYLKAENQRKDRRISLLTGAVITILILIIAALIIDLTHHDIGWYQTAAQWFASMGVRI